MGRNNISILSPEDCCGCRACGDVCPTGAISFNEDSEGFLYPRVDSSICILCGKCTRICPELNLCLNPKASDATAAYAKDSQARQAGSSGGIFGLLAQRFCDEGGFVYGAAFDSNLQLIHVKARNSAEIQPILRSKYIQSNTSGIYHDAISELQKGKKVLFSGTPCQCNAIRNAVGPKLSELLTTVEVICHGVPSQSLFNKSINWLENRRNCRITSFAFRSKYPKALHPQAYSFTYIKDGDTRVVNGLHYQNPFYFGFQKYITLRPSCYNCKWARPERSADITLGDFWGIEKYCPDLNAKEGVSMAIINSEKGQELIDKIVNGNRLFTKNLPIAVAIENNGCLSSPTPRKPSRDAFFAALAKEPFNEVAKRFLVPRRKWIFDIYYGLPAPLRKVVRKIMDKKMRYE